MASARLSSGISDGQSSLPRFAGQLGPLLARVAARADLIEPAGFADVVLAAMGESHLGGPAKGLFLLVTAVPLKDLAIPGADYSFAQLQFAIALGDFESLGRRRRPVIRLHLTGGAESGLTKLEAILNNALWKSSVAAL